MLVLLEVGLEQDPEGARAGVATVEVQPEQGEDCADCVYFLGSGLRSQPERAGLALKAELDSSNCPFILHQSPIYTCSALG
jgi:hypothetical protein